MDGTRDATVLLVEDEIAVLESFEMMLEDSFDVKTAHDGSEALAQIDDAVDVVLLDRMMPGLSGDEVLAEIRNRELNCRVVMVTAVDPDFDIIGMGFDDYVTKPPTETELRETITDVLDRGDYSGRIQEYHSLLAKQSILQEEKDESELANSEEFAELEEQIDEIRQELDEDNERLLDDTEFVGALRDLGGESEEENPEQ